jgi:hypothetical protein
MCELHDRDRVGRVVGQVTMERPERPLHRHRRGNGTALLTPNAGFDFY